MKTDSAEDEEAQCELHQGNRGSHQQPSVQAQSFLDLLVPVPGLQKVCRLEKNTRTQQLLLSWDGALFSSLFHQEPMDQ